MELKKWFQINEGHTPIIITINAKDSEIPLIRKPLPFTSETLQSTDTEIKEVFIDEQLTTPDRVWGNFETLEEAMLTSGWPLLKEGKSRFLFVLDEGEEKTNKYLSNFPNSKGAILFVNKDEGNPNAAFRIINDPIKNLRRLKTCQHCDIIVYLKFRTEIKDWLIFQAADLPSSCWNTS